MPSSTLVIDDILEPDHLGCRIANYWLEWDMLRERRISEWREIQEYIFATDTTKTSNAKLPWSNKTTIPKLCQIRDNLYANYMATLFPKRKWLSWEGDSDVDDDLRKRTSIEAYMGWVVDRNEFYDEVSKLVLDYIDYGNCFCIPEWVDRSVTLEGSFSKQVGYVGPLLRRISPLDIVFNPTAPSFLEAPKIIRSIVSLGDIKQMIEQETMDPVEREELQQLWDYMKNTRSYVSTHAGDFQTKDRIYSVAGFTDYRSYLCSSYVEVLTFYGDLYDEENDVFLKNHVIKVVDRHKLLSKRPNTSYFGAAPIYHAGWRIRPDSIWAMGPLDNLLGMQYRIDHLENMKADCFDLIAYPPLKIKGYIDDFKWGPFERIYVGDSGDVELMSPDVAALQADTQIAILEQKMEEMAGSPKEAMGFRTPGEKTAFEVQRMENAASRIFQNKTAQFERTIVENALNAMLELARRFMGESVVRVFSDDLKIAEFMKITPYDIAGLGRIKPVAARNFAEKATHVQNLANFYGSPAGQDEEVRQHFSAIQTAKMWETLLDLEPFSIVNPYIRLTERADAARIAQSNEEQVQMEAMTAGGMIEGDHDPEATFLQ